MEMSRWPLWGFRRGETSSTAGSLLSKPALFPALQRLAVNAETKALVAANALGRRGVAALPARDEVWLAY